MIPLTLAEIAAGVGGALVGADPAPSGDRAGGVRLPQGSARAGCSSRSRARRSTGTTSRPRRSPPARSRCSAPARCRACRWSWSTIRWPRMGRLARAVLDRLPELTVVGLTGSSGKTTTKDLIAQLLARLGPTVAPPGSFNNELGRPYTVLQADAGHPVPGAGDGRPRHRARRATCAEIAPPRIGVVLNVGVAHIGEFGSVEAIAAGQGRAGRGAARRTGVAVLNADDPRVRGDGGADRRAEVVLVGEAADADRAGRWTCALDERGRAVVHAGHRRPGRAPVRAAGQPAATRSATRSPRRRWRCSWACRWPTCRRRWASCGSCPTRRMDVFDRADGVTVIDDSYNANPASTAAALRALAGDRARGGGRSPCSATMAELGRVRAGRARRGRPARRGARRRPAHRGRRAAPRRSTTARRRWRTGEESRCCVTDQEAAIALLREELRPGDVVLVKGSRYRTWDVSRDALAGRRRAAAVRAVIVAAAVGVHRLAVRHAAGDPGVHRAQGRPADPHRWARRRTWARRARPTMGGVVFIVATVLAYVAGHFALTTLPDAADRARSGRPSPALVLLGLFVFCGAGRLPRRLPQGAQAQQPRAEQAGQAARPDDRRRRSSASLALYVPEHRPGARPWRSEHDLVHPGHQLAGRRQGRLA